MLKMAIFVEGQTEALFVHRLINEITTRHDIKITMANAKMPLVIEVGSGSDPDAYSAHISIKDYGGDGNVATQVRDNYNLLVSKGFSTLVGSPNSINSQICSTHCLQAPLRTAIHPPAVSPPFRMQFPGPHTLSNGR